MSMYVYGEWAERTHENQMLQSFLEELETRWGTSDDWIFVIANSMWNGAEIDIVCILPSGLMVADFKNHGGELTGTENGPWRADGVPVKGGRKANPFQQLRDNRFSVLNWLQSKSLLNGRNLGHISAGAIFSRGIVDNLDLPPKVRSWFFPTDVASCSTLLGGLGSPELSIAEGEAREVVRLLGTRELKWYSKRPKLRAIEPDIHSPVTPPPLTAKQQEALESLVEFSGSEGLTSFCLLGMTSTGKTRVLSAFIEELAKVDRTSIVLVPNRRLADSTEVEATSIKSIYSHLYNTGDVDGDDSGGDYSDPKKPARYSLRKCNDDYDCVYLVDDAHLLGNASFTTPDGKQFGSGHLFEDFLKFAELGEGQRKVVFFGDPYQIHRATGQDSILNGEFQEARKLGHQAIELTQVIDTNEGSASLTNALRLVSAIRQKKFASLELEEGRDFKFATSKDAAGRMLEDFRSDPKSTWYLAETHSLVNSFTTWIRKSLHAKRHLSVLEKSEIIEIYVAPVEDESQRGGEDSLQSKPRWLRSGSPQVVTRVGEPEEHLQELKGRPSKIRFHSIECGIRGHNEAIRIFQEFLTAEKPELDKDLAIAERVWRRPTKSDAENGAAIKPGFLYARYGYGSTVHHAQGMSRRKCYLNCDHSAGKHTEGYFRWLYSAITAAEKELILLNFSPVHPLDSAEWKSTSAAEKSDIPVGAGWSFQPDGIVAENDQKRTPPSGLDQSKTVLKTAAIWLCIAKASEALGWAVSSVSSHPYQEIFELAGPDGRMARMRIAYSAKNVVKALHVDDPDQWPILRAISAGCVYSSQSSQEATTLLSFIRSRLHDGDWRIVSSTESSYRLAITLARAHDERVSLEMSFDKEGLVTSVRPVLASKLELIEEIRGGLM